jgi:hypothetical protein
MVFCGYNKRGNFLDKSEEQEHYTHIHHKFPYTSSFDLGIKS